MIFSCNKRLYSIAPVVAVEHYPSITEVAHEIVGGNMVTYNQLKLISNQGLISISGNLAFNFALQCVLLRLQGSIVLCKYKISIQWLPPWKNSETSHFLTMTILLPTWPKSYLTILRQPMVLSWQMKKKNWHGGQPIVAHFYIGQM